MQKCKFFIYYSNCKMVFSESCSWCPREKVSPFARSCCSRQIRWPHSRISKFASLSGNIRTTEKSRYSIGNVVLYPFSIFLNGGKWFSFFWNLNFLLPLIQKLFVPWLSYGTRCLPNDLWVHRSYASRKHLTIWDTPEAFVITFAFPQTPSRPFYY